MKTPFMIKGNKLIQMSQSRLQNIFMIYSINIPFFPLTEYRA